MPSGTFLRKTRTATPQKAGFFSRHLTRDLLLVEFDTRAKKGSVGPDIITRGLGLFGRPLDGNRLLGSIRQGKGDTIFHFIDQAGGR